VLELLELARYQIPTPIKLVNDVPESLTCRLQRDAMRQMLLNLVLNASQALGERSGAITVTATRDADHLRIAVLDDGPGFPSELLEVGPRPFYSSRKGGYGLGLSTVARMARGMGGQLELHNRIPSGAVATLLVACNGET
jgi:signal transduction histidine kinase